MKLILKILVIFLFLTFLQPGSGNELLAQRSSIRYSNPQKQLKKTIRRVRKEDKLQEKRRTKRFKEAGIGPNRKSGKAATREKKQKDKTGSYLDRVLTDKKNVSPAEKQAAYRTDRQLTRGKNRQKSLMKKSKARKRKPSRGN